MFQKALKQFRMTLLTTYGLSQRGDGALALGIKYRDLIDSFASVSGRDGETGGRGYVDVFCRVQCGNASEYKGTCVGVKAE